MKNIIILLIATIFCDEAFSQKYDYMWIFSRDRNSDIPGSDGFIMDFNEEPVDIYYINNYMNIQRTNASICDTSGLLLFYTNGIFISNAFHEPLYNGGGLNPGQYTSDFTDTGLPIVQGALFLPFPEKDSLYILLHLARDWSGVISPSSIVRRYYYSIIDHRIDNNMGGVIEKNTLLIEDTLNIGKLSIVRHANGRDWWSIIQEYNSNRFYRVLISPEGIQLKEPQLIGDNIFSGAGQVVFSPDGTKFVQFTTVNYELGQFLYIFDFDRCTGLLENPRYITYNDSAIVGGVAISPDSRYLYVSSYNNIYQFDLWSHDIAETKNTVATYDGYSAPFSTRFYFAQLAPNGKIYINTSSSADVMHVINSPNLPGDSCDVCQHCIELPTRNSFSLPNFPNYRLHHLEGSPCDTLRQPPVAEWAHEPLGMEVAFQDASFHDIRTWHWSFGDGAVDTVPNPVHSYAAEGVYNVCLAVSNPRGADTLCREVQVLVSSAGFDSAGFGSAGFGSAQPAVWVWPNPTSGRVLLEVTGGRLREGLSPRETLSSPTAGQRGRSEVEIRDALGRVVLRIPLQVVNGRIRQELDVSDLTAGVYFVELVSDGGMHLGGGKLVIVH